MADQVYKAKGQAVYRKAGHSHEYSVSWGPGDPPVKVEDHLGGNDPVEFEREGDDPAAGLVDAPQPEPPPAA